MNSLTEKRFPVFYSWQSDLPAAANNKLIRAALDAALDELNSDDDLQLIVVRDEATRDLPGSPNIVEAIFTKIRQAEAFVCDLSKVCEKPNSAGELRKYCNPNVAIELGYAIRVLGWDRIVLVFNTAFGNLPEDLPFDARGYRTLPFNCNVEWGDTGRPTTASKSKISKAKGQLRTGLLVALKAIAKSNPKRPEGSGQLTPTAEKRKRDLEQLREVFHWISLVVHHVDNVG